MKVQIRQGVFETNSSTQHTLCVVKCDEKRFKSSAFWASLPRKIVVPGPNDLKKYEGFAYDIPHIDNLTLEEKVNILIISSLNSYSVPNFLNTIMFLQDALKKFEIELCIDFQALCDISESYWYQDGIYRLIDEKFPSEYIKDFLFSADAGYASYCDEGCMKPGQEYNDLINHMGDLLKNGTPEEDILVFHNRC